MSLELSLVDQYSPVGRLVASIHRDGNVALLGVREEVLPALELVVELGLCRGIARSIYRSMNTLLLQTPIHMW